MEKEDFETLGTAIGMIGLGLSLGSIVSEAVKIHNNLILDWVVVSFVSMLIYIIFKNIK